MLLNWKEEITKIDPDIKFRLNGGLLKTVKEQDKSVKNGYSLVGDFVKTGDFEDEQSEGVYLDCKDGKVRLLDMVIDGKQDWAPELWAAVEDEF